MSPEVSENDMDMLIDLDEGFGEDGGAEQVSSCSTLEKNTETVYTEEDMLFSVGLDDVVSCCELCHTYEDCVRWAIDTKSAICTLLKSGDDLQFRYAPKWISGGRDP